MRIANNQLLILLAGCAVIWSIPWNNCLCEDQLLQNSDIYIKLDTFKKKAFCVIVTSDVIRVDISTWPLPSYYFDDEGIFSPHLYKVNKTEGAFVVGKSECPVTGMALYVIYLDNDTSATFSMKNPTSYRFGGSLHRLVTFQMYPDISSPFIDPFLNTSSLGCILLDSHMFVKSVGPDGIEDIVPVKARTKDDADYVLRNLYDPTNGVVSRGDLLFPSFAEELSK